jgi:hypothetical protein
MKALPESQPRSGRRLPRILLLALALGWLAAGTALLPPGAWRTALAWLDREPVRVAGRPEGSPAPSPEDDITTLGPIPVAVGDVLPDLTLEDLNGRRAPVARPAGLPVVIEFGSATCPICVDGLESMRSVAEHHAGEAEFVFVYCREAHRSTEPEVEYLYNGWPRRRAANAAERRQGAELLRKWVEPSRRMLVDGFGPDSVYDRLFGGSGADDSLVIVGADGRVAWVSRWAYADEVEAYLKDLPNPARNDRP